mgnify:CR=1 FL=1
MFKLLKNYSWKEVFWILVVVALVSLQVHFDLKLPDYMSEITRLVETEGSAMSDIIHNGVMMIGCAFASLLAAIVVGYIASNLSATLSLRIRKTLFDKVERLDLESYQKFSTGSLITRTTNDITQIHNMIIQLLDHQMVLLNFQQNHFQQNHLLLQSIYNLLS